MTLQKTLTVLVILIVLMGLFSGVAAAKNDNEEQNSRDNYKGEESTHGSISCSDGENEEGVSEELAGVSPDGTELLIKRTTTIRGEKTGNDKNKVKTNDAARNRRSTPVAPASTCYGLMGIKWTTFPVRYTINPTNTQELTQDFIVNALSKSTKTWDDATSRALFGRYTIDTSAPFGVVDGKNTMAFGENYADPSVIAVTYTWYYSVSKRIAEFDISFETDYQWGNAVSDPAKMDVQDIATHEIGHGVGLLDLYTAPCAEETMYGYASYGETKKRTLNAGDKAGIKTIYG